MIGNKNKKNTIVILYNKNIKKLSSFHEKYVIDHLRLKEAENTRGIKMNSSINRQKNKYR